MIKPLLTIPEAAEALGVPVGALRSSAERHGLLVRMGRSLRIDPDDLKELVEKCRKKPKDRASIGAPTRMSGSFATQGGRIDRPAAQVAEMLKRSLPNTSPKGIDQVVRLKQAN